MPVVVCSGNGTTQDQVGVVIVDHGSRKKASNDMLLEFGALYGSVSGRQLVEVAHMEIAKPSIQQAIDRCVERGATSVVVAPYFLSRGRHVQEDIPALVSEAQAKHPSVKCVIAEPIGIDTLMAQLIDNRVRDAQRRLTEEPAADGCAAEGGVQQQQEAVAAAAAHSQNGN